MKIITVVGARPQFIKAALISRELKRKGIDEIIVHTGQHYDENMSDIFFNQMGIPKPKYNLKIQANTHGSMTGRMIEGIEEILIREEPDVLVVYGDTNSTLAAALAARKLNIRIAHIEAGLRNFDFTVPEDVNRVLTDRISDILFCPTDTAMTNLLNEGFESFPCRIVRTGDLMADCVSVFGKMLKDENVLLKSEIPNLPKDGVLVTIHRQETTKPNILKDVVAFLNKISLDHPIIFPIHPRTQKVINSLGLKLDNRVQVIDPVGYLEMQYLLKFCLHVITDSGGLQKEAYLHKKKSLVLMNFTPWVELIDNKCSITTELNFKDMMCNFKNSQELDSKFDTNLYGNGNSREQIVEEIIKLKNDKL